MSDLIRGEWMKAWTGRAWVILLLIGALMAGLTSYGYAEEGAALASDADLAAITHEVVEAWMMLLLFASILGALLVTREYAGGSIGRSVLLSGSRGRLLLAKVVVGVWIGALFGAVAVVGGVVSAATMVAVPVWNDDVWLTAAGVFVVNLVAAPWGVLIGWLVRQQIAAVMTLMALTLIVDPALQRLVPDVARYLMTIAMSSVYRDGKPELLSVPVALFVMAGWLVGAWFAARRAFLSRDVL